MSSAIPDLWPADFGSLVKLTPEAILKVQATKLAERTGGSVVGEVKTRIEDGTVYSNFNLVAPALNNYRYKLFYIAHGFNPYPLDFVSTPSIPHSIQNEAQFLEKLGEILRAESTATIVNSLIQHSQE